MIINMNPNAHPTKNIIIGVHQLNIKNVFINIQIPLIKLTILTIESSFESISPTVHPTPIAQSEYDIQITDIALGAEILRKALEGPARQIVENAGLEPAVVVNEILAKKGANGFDARAEEYVDMVKAGIIDPTLVTRTAVQNAASIAALLLTTEVAISDKPEPAGAGPAMPDMGGMGGGMGGMM